MLPAHVLIGTALALLLRGFLFGVGFSLAWLLVT